MPVHITNFSSATFFGWKQTTTDVLPPHPIGRTRDDTLYVLGSQIGQHLWNLDVWVDMGPGQTIKLDLSNTQPVEGLKPPQLPADIVGHFGGPLRISTYDLVLVSVRRDAMSWRTHMRGWVGTMLVADVWFSWRPSTPFLVEGEVMLTASNPTVVSQEALSQEHLRLSFGDGLVHMLGAGWNQPIAPGDTHFADGQARIVPFVVFWARHAPDAESWSQAFAAVNRCIVARGVERLWPLAAPRRVAPRPPEDLDAALARINDWSPAVVGPDRNAAVTGAQQDQGFPGGEAFADPRGSEVYYLSALKVAARPCHHRDRFGAPIDPELTRHIMWWYGRPHPATGDMLGKDGPLTADTNGWSGPDREHWFYNGLFAAFRLTGSTACQHLIEEQARLFLRSETVDPPEWFTSGPDSARSVGWAMLLAVQLHEHLTDRALAERVKQRALARIDRVYRPTIGTRAFWDIRTDDPRLGPGDWWMPWQQAVGAYGLYVASARFGTYVGKGIAVVAAQAVLDHAWKLSGGRWQTAPIAPVPSAVVASAVEATVEPDRHVVAHARAWVHEDTGVPRSTNEALLDGGPSLFDESFNYFGMAMAVAVILKHTPEQTKARAIWRQLQQTPETGNLQWLAPEVTV